MTIENCNDCGICCLNTEMILFKQDIDLIINSHPKMIYIKDFCHKTKDGFYQLNNIDGHCIFFDIKLKKCEIYRFRPKGCVIYPLAYDLSKQKCIIDNDCPRPHLFYQDNENLEISCKELKKYLRRNHVF